LSEGGRDEEEGREAAPRSLIRPFHLACGSRGDVPSVPSNAAKSERAKIVPITVKASS
jgi:hypothetical protein